MIEVGQILSLRIRFNNYGTNAIEAHPVLVVRVDCKVSVIEVIHLDSTYGKPAWKALLPCNALIKFDNPKETVIDEESYAQLDNKFQIEMFHELIQTRRQIEKLSKDKLDNIIYRYNKYHKENGISDDKNVYMDKIEILNLNPNIVIL